MTHVVVMKKMLISQRRFAKNDALVFKLLCRSLHDNYPLNDYRAAFNENKTYPDKTPLAPFHSIWL